MKGLIQLFSMFSFFLFCLLSLGLVVWARLGDPFVSQKPRGDGASHSLELFWLVHIPFVRLCYILPCDRAVNQEMSLL